MMQIVNFSDAPNVKQSSLFQRMKTMETNMLGVCTLDD
jgi:hypothetical protein